MDTCTVALSTTVTARPLSTATDAAATAAFGFVYLAYNCTPKV